ncbi:MAG: hypothetical protein PHR38_08185 [Bacteroidales bacterium]|nr:hypothetical protein [Bacteroidales bacterium]MDD4713097.1 hypothetical protein [Bacteroidales bacterium]
MKKNSLTLYMIMFVGLLMPFNAIGQTAMSNVTLGINGTALLGITTGASVALSLGGAAEAGAPIQEASADSTARLRISSLTSLDSTRTISASISTGMSKMTTSNTELLVRLGDPNANFSNAGNKGTLIATPIVLSGTDAPVVTGIKTCWSGTGADDGYRIIYTFRRKALATTFSSPGAITVTYTLSNSI